MRKLALTVGLIALSLPSAVIAQEPELPPIEIPLCEEFCETWSRDPFLVLRTDKPQSQFEFCLVEGLSRFSTPPNRYPYRNETILMVYWGGSAGYRIAIRIVPETEGYLVAGFTKRSGLAEKVAEIMQVCTQD